jgi:long-chain fatty acid transport protein
VPQTSRALLMFLLTVAMAGGSQPGDAAGFSLLEQTASGIGQAYAGAAASADDASSLYFNPATLSLLSKPQIAAAVHGIDLRAEFRDRGSSLPPAGGGM